MVRVSPAALAEITVIAARAVAAPAASRTVIRSRSQKAMGGRPYSASASSTRTNPSGPSTVMSASRETSGGDSSDATAMDAVELS